MGANKDKVRGNGKSPLIPISNLAIGFCRLCPLIVASNKYWEGSHCWMNKEEPNSSPIQDHILKHYRWDKY